MRNSIRSWTGAAMRVAGPALAVLIWAAAADAQFAFHNIDITNNTGASQNTLTVVLSGDQTANLSSVFYNPFTTIPLSPASVSFDGTNTTLTYTGPNAVGAGGLGHYGFGFSGTTLEPGGYGSSPVLDAYWGGTSSSSSDTPVPTVDANTAPPLSGNTKFIIVYSTIELGPTNVAGEWSELAVPDGGKIQVGIGNNDTTDGPLFSFDTKFFLSDTLIPLDDLNDVYEPPAGSNFQPLPGIPDGTQVNPGSSAESSMIDTPEPVMLGWAAGLVVLGRRRRARVC